MSPPDPDTPQSGGPLLTAPVNRVLLSMAAPISVGMLSTFLFQVVDTYFVGQLGPLELAALGFSATTYFLAVAIFMGVAVGVSALVGAAFGTDDRALARRYTTVASVGALLVSGVVAVVGVLSLEPLFRRLGAGPELLPLIDAYMTTLYAGMPLLVFGLVAGSALRATGEVKPPEIVMAIAGVINLVFDYLLIFGMGPFPRLELQGAALATVGSWVFVAVCMLVLLLRRGLLTLDKGNVGAELKQILRLSSPAVATQILLPVTAMFITFLAAKSGPEVVAAFGVAQRIETLALVGISAVTIAIVPFVAQNFGAEAHRRVDQAIVFAGKTAVYWGGALCILLVAFAGPIAGIFTEDATIIGYTKLYFYVVSASYAPYGFVMMTAAIFNGIQLPGRSLRVLLVKTFIFTVPLALAGSTFGAIGVFAAIGVSNLLGGIYAAAVMKPAMAQLGSEIADARPLQDYLSDWRAVASKVKQRVAKP